MVSCFVCVKQIKEARGHGFYWHRSTYTHIYSMCIGLNREGHPRDDRHRDKLEGLDHFISRNPSDNCSVVFKNLTRAHFASHCLYNREYAVDLAHTDYGTLKEIANCNFKTDCIDAYKLAQVYKDIWSGRGFIRRTHISSDTT